MTAANDLIDKICRLPLIVAELRMAEPGAADRLEHLAERLEYLAALAREAYRRLDV